MKKVDFKERILLTEVEAGISLLWHRWHRQQLPLAIFLALCLNLVIAPIVYAAAKGELERYQAWSLGILGLVTLGLTVYLFVVVFQPERF